jgi:hypothetical protein
MKSFQNEKCRRDVNIPYLNKDAFGVAKWLRRQQRQPSTRYRT